MNNKLKPCPFCGSTRVRVMYSDINKAHVVYCTNCKASTNIAVREEDAIYLWNKRAEPERKKGHWTGDCCSCCGVSKYNYIKMVDDECGPFGTWNFCPHCGADMRGDRCTKS